MARTRKERTLEKHIETILHQVFYGGASAPLIGVSYERVSSRKQVIGTSLETQPIDIEAWAGRHNIRIAHHYVDRGRSGRTANRADYQRMMDELAQRGVQVVLVWKLDRFARNMLLQLEEIEKFKSKGIALISITEMIDYSTAMGKQMLAQAALAAQAYSDQLGERMERALRHTAEHGYWVGPVPFGYERQGKHQPLRPTDDAALVKEIFDLYSTELYGDTSLAAAMNRAGYTGRDWRNGERISFTREYIRTVLTNRAYIGKLSCGGVEYDGKHEAIIGLDLWARCQHIRAMRAHSNAKVHHRERGMLHGIAHCAVCGDPMWQHSGGSRTAPRTYYRCSNLGRLTCDATMSRIDIVDPLLEEVLLGLAFPTEVIGRVLENLEASVSMPIRPARDTSAAQQRLNDLYIKGRLSEEDYEVQYAALATQAEPMERCISTVDMHRAAMFLHNLPHLFNLATVEEQRELVTVLFETLWIQDKKITAVTPHQVYLSLIERAAAIDSVVGVADGLQKPSTHLRHRPPSIWMSHQNPIALPDWYQRIDYAYR